MRYLLFLLALPAWAQFGAASAVVAGNGAPVSAQCTNVNNVGRVWARKDGGAADTTFYVCGATGAGTYGWSLFGSGTGGGYISGASSVAATQVLYGVSAGVAGSEAAFVWDSTNDLLGVGVSGVTRVTIGRYQSGTAATLYLATTPGISNWALLSTSGDLFVNSPTTSSPLIFLQGNTERARFAATTGNLLLGTTTDDTVAKLQVAGNIAAVSSVGGEMLRVTATAGFSSIVSVGSSEGNLTLQDTGATASAQAFNLNSDGGSLNFRLLNDARSALVGKYGSLSSAGTWSFYNEVATVGVTQLIVRAGAGQSSTKLISVLTNAGSPNLWSIDAVGNVVGDNATANYIINPSAGLNAPASWVISWANSTSGGGTKDLYLSRALANVLDITSNGTTGGGLRIEGLKSTTGEVFVCVDTTGRFTRSATACVGTI